MSMRVLVIEPERRPEVREIDDSLKAMQQIVGGLIQPIYLDDSVALVCNDESDHLTDLTPEQIEQYQKLFYTPEMFWGMDGHIVCIPIEADREVANDGRHI